MTTTKKETNKNPDILSLSILIPLYICSYITESKGCRTCVSMETEARPVLDK